MPRSPQSPIGRIVDFFRQAPLEVMNIASDLVRDVVADRNKKSRDAKERAKPVKKSHKKKAAKPAPAAAPTPKAAKVKGKKKQVRAPRQRRQTQEELPPPPSEEDLLDPDDNALEE